ncbi:MAG TPA: mechanosensitive ion channel family protein [Allosphingosinicella sp.]|nr:mechanosensitive ion channel family protein [Allosphingosinicella sp.]
MPHAASSSPRPAAPAHIGATLSERMSDFATAFSHWVTGNIIGIIIAAAVGTGLALAMLAIRSLGCKLIAKLGTDPHWPVIFARVLAKTKVYFIVLLAAELVATHADTPPVVMSVIHALFVIAFAIQAAVWARELVLGYVEHRVGGDTAGHTTLGSAVGIIRLLVTVALFAIALVLVLDNLGVNVTGLVAGLGIGGIAIGLAAQGIFSDLFAALSILFDKPFRRGDSIKFGDVSGNVELIGLKTTRVRSITGEQVIVANGKLLEQQIHNFAYLKHRRVVLALGLICQTPPDVCRKLPAMLKEIVEKHDKAKVVRCGMVGFGASTLDFELQFDVHSTDYEFVYRTKSDVCIDILDAFNEANIQMAYPSQTTFTAAPDGSLIMPYAPVKLVEEKDEETASPGQPGHEPQGQDG